MAKFLIIVFVLLTSNIPCFADLTPKERFFEKAKDIQNLKFELIFPKSAGEQLGVKFINTKGEDIIINVGFFNKAVGSGYDVFYIDKDGKEQDLWINYGAGFPLPIPNNEKNLKSVKSGEVLYSEKMNRNFLEFLKELPENTKNMVKISSINLKVELLNVVGINDSKSTSLFIHLDFSGDMINQFFPEYSGKVNDTKGSLNQEKTTK